MSAGDQPRPGVSSDTDRCVAETDEDLAMMPPADRDYIEGVIDSCSEEEGCAFVDCVCNTIGSDTPLCRAARGTQ